MSDQDILLHYRKSQEIIRKIEEEAQQLKRAGDQDLENVLRDIRSGWSGENADAFLTKAEAMQQKIRTSAEELLKMAESMQKSAEEFRRADRDVASRMK